MIIILTGLPGSGKSSSGYHLSKKLNYLFVDLDEQIERATKNNISDIFNKYGEKYFRKQEFLMLENILSKHKKENLVLSLGGGTFTNKINIKLCKTFGYVIWLNTSLNLIHSRLIKNINSRPIFENKSDFKMQLENLYLKRMPYYKQATKTIDIHKELSLDNISNLIIENII